MGKCPEAPQAPSPVMFMAPIDVYMIKLPYCILNVLMVQFFIDGSLQARLFPDMRYMSYACTLLIHRPPHMQTPKKSLPICYPRNVGSVRSWGSKIPSGETSQVFQGTHAKANRSQSTQGPGAQGSSRVESGGFQP